MEKNVYPYIAHDFSGNVLSLLLLLFIIILTVSFYISPFYIDACPLTTCFSSTFIKNGCWILLKNFSVLVKLLYSFCSWVCLCSGLCILTWVCSTILIFLGWSQLDFSRLFILCILELSLEIHYWEFWHRCLSGRLVYSFLFVVVSLFGLDISVMMAS